MNLLLNDEYAPITSEIGFIKCPASVVVKAFVDWQTKIYTASERHLEIIAAQGQDTLPHALKKLLPLTSPERRRALFIQTVGEWTAYFDNGKLGTDAFPVISTLCEKLDCIGIRAAHIPHSLDEIEGNKKGRYGATILEIYGSQQTHFLNIIRSISLGHDGSKWSFSVTGDPQVFESLESYKIKLKKDRFTPELLDKYLQAMGIRMFDVDFYKSEDEYYLVEKVGALLPNSGSYSLLEVRNSVGLE